MLYDKLRKLPKVIQEEIYETGDLSLLTDEPEKYSSEFLAELWLKLDEEYQRKYSSNQKNSEILTLVKEIEFQSGRFEIIANCCEQLKFDYNEQVIEILSSHGYKFNKDNYQASIERIERESKAILTKIKILADKLPKQTETNAKTTIIDVMASITSILNVSFDFNTLSVEAFHAYLAQTTAKIKSVEKQISEQKAKTQSTKKR